MKLFVFVSVFLTLILVVMFAADSMVDRVEKARQSNSVTHDYGPSDSVLDWICDGPVGKSTQVLRVVPTRCVEKRYCWKHNVEEWVKIPVSKRLNIIWKKDVLR